MERKVQEAFATKANDQGIVETIFAVFGNIDAGLDRIHPGAFAKTFAERGQSVKILDHHRADSIMSAIGKPLELRELPKGQLPHEVLTAFPDATGGAYAKIQLLMDTPEGKGAFERIKNGIISQWSFGYDALDKDYEQVKQNGKDITVRNLRTLKLYEVSPVLWPMNEATVTLSAKEAGPSEAKPWGVHKRESQFCVYKHDPDGNPTGDTLGCHDTEDEAEAQMRALYANEEGDGKAAPDAPEADKGLDALWAEIESLKAAIAAIQDTDAPASEQAAQDTPQEDEQAGPADAPPTSDDLLAQIEIERERLRLLEV